jgi:hypothetical protein
VDSYGQLAPPRRGRRRKSARLCCMRWRRKLKTPVQSTGADGSGIPPSHHHFHSQQKAHSPAPT